MAVVRDGHMEETAAAEATPSDLLVDGTAFSEDHTQAKGPHTWISSKSFLRSSMLVIPTLL